MSRRRGFQVPADAPRWCDLPASYFNDPDHVPAQWKRDEDEEYEHIYGRQRDWDEEPPSHWAR